MYSQKQLEEDIAAALKLQETQNKLGKRDATRDCIQIVPSVSFYEGTPEHPIRHITSGRGRLTAAGLISLTNLIGSSYTSTLLKGWVFDYGVGGSGVPAVPSIRLGTGTTATIYSTNQLATIINTVPNSISGSISNPSAGVYKVTVTATWNAGTLGTPTITEAALYANCESVQNSFGDAAASYATFLVDRVCSTDGDFTEFEVNQANPLTVNYPIQISFSAPT